VFAVFVVSVAVFIAALKVTETVVETLTAVAPLAGLVAVTERTALPPPPAEVPCEGFLSPSKSGMPLLQEKRNNKRGRTNETRMLNSPN
jgi:hypothetical protein